MLVDVINKHSPGKKVTIVSHDWGAALSYLLVDKHPELIKRMATIDIGSVLSENFDLSSMSF
jgi:pimeloyl-ACP methyl ester carboxylesterase